MFVNDRKYFRTVITDKTTENAANELIKQISAGVDEAKKSESDTVITEEDIKTNLSLLMSSGVSIVDELHQQLILGGAVSPELVEATARMLASMATLADSAGRFVMQDKDIAAKKDLQDQKHKGKLKEIEHLSEQKIRIGGDTTTNNITIIATREEILDGLLEKAAKAKEDQAKARAIREMEIVDVVESPKELADSPSSALPVLQPPAQESLG